jgi:predicted DNA-binding protein (MmcQ/YjbR family)
MTVGAGRPARSLHALAAVPVYEVRDDGAAGAGHKLLDMARLARRDRVIAACAAKPGAAEDYPFGGEVAVFKVGGKMFALVALGPPPGSVSLKCDPDLAAGLRRRYAAITAGYHLNKRHWNTITLDGSVPDDELLGLIEHSYELVVARLPRAQRPGP